MSEVLISDSILRALWADFAWYKKDPVGTPSLRLEQLCVRIEALLDEYRTKRQIDQAKDPYGDYQ